jgi:hypothetical protein
LVQAAKCESEGFRAAIALPRAQLMLAVGERVRKAEGKWQQ